MSNASLCQDRPTFTHEELAEEIKRVGAASYIVQGMLMEGSIALMAGRATIGKSPLVYQLALCVAAGKPFLGLPTTQTGVLMHDLENPALDGHEMRERLARFLGLPAVPPNFTISRLTGVNGLQRAVEACKPGLVLIDPLRRFEPSATSKAETTAQLILNLGQLAARYHTAFVLVHHLRKENRDHPGPHLDADTSVEEWMQQAEGARALVDHATTRIAVERGEGEIALRMRWNIKIVGDSAMLPLVREFGDEESPLGYRLAGLDSILDPALLSTFHALPSEFRFNEAARRFGCGKGKTNSVLRACVQAGALEKADGLYRKLSAPRSPLQACA